MNDLLTADSLTCRRGARVVLRGVSLAVGAGGCLLVTGANGSGKSTLLRVLAGLAPAEGAVRWNGATIGENSEALRLCLRYVGHQDAVKPELTAREMLGYWAEILACDAATPPAGFGIDSFLDRPIRFLSAGQRRRVALTRLLIGAAPLWLLDEPATTLDRAGQGLLMEVIAAHRAKGGIAVIATHDELPVPDAQMLHLQGLA